MIFYDSYGNKKEFHLQEPFNSGYCSYVYQYDTQNVLKIYHTSCGRGLRIKQDIYNQIKEINSEHTVKINELLYKKDHTASVFKLRKPPVAAYTYEYIRDDKIDILTVNTEYLVHNMNELNKLFTEFSKRGIRVADLKKTNTIMQKDKIVLIDPDLFFKALIKGESLERANQIDLLYLFKEILLDAAYYEGYGHYDGYCYYDDYNDFAEDCINKIFDSSVKQRNPVIEVTKHFQKYKHPIDMINEHVKNRFN